MQCSLLLLIHLHMYSTYTCQQKIWTRSRARSWKITTVKKLHEASLQNRRNFLVFFRGTEASGRRTRCTSHDQGEECKPTSPHAWLALRARLALASDVLKNAKKVTPVLQADRRLKNELLVSNQETPETLLLLPCKVLKLELQKLDLRPW